MMIKVADCFNNILERVLEKKESHYIIRVVEILDDPSYFSHNNWNGDGQVRFWSEVDHQIEMCDARKMSLKPAEDPKLETFEETDRPSGCQKMQLQQWKNSNNPSHFWFAHKGKGNKGRKQNRNKGQGLTTFFNHKKIPQPPPHHHY